MHRSIIALLALGLTVVTACSGNRLGTGAADRGLEVAARLEQPPGNLTITPDGEWVLSLHQFFNPPFAVGQFRDGRVVQFPPGEPGPLGLTSVLGIRSDTAGVVWMLDNGKNQQAPPRLVAWDTRGNRQTRTIDLAAATDSNSFVNDFDFDYRRNRIYISDPAGGSNAAIVVVDLRDGSARRVLEGHPSTVPEDIRFTVDGDSLVTPDGSYPRTGADGIGLDYEGECTTGR